MAYQTGTTTDPVDLLQKLVAFLQANGWTVNASAASGTGHWKAHLARNGLYVNLFATAGNGTGSNPWAHGLYATPIATSGALHLFLGTGYNGGSAWNAQAGGPIVYSGSNTIGIAMRLQSTGLGGYHFFAAGDCVVVMVEQTPGLWVNCGWGNLQKAGVWTGGAYFFGCSIPYYLYSSTVTTQGYGQSAYAPCANGDSYNEAWSNTFVRADVDAFANKWMTIGGSSGTTAGSPYNCTGKTGAGAVYGGNTPQNTIPGNNGIAFRAVSSVTGQITLAPTRLYAARDASPGGYSLLGAVPDCFEVRHSFTPGKEMTIGADTYVLFPNCAIRKTA